MNFDDLQSVWQSQNHSTPVPVDTDSLLKAVQRDHRQLAAKLLTRDITEVSVAATLAVFFAWVGIERAEWSFCLLGVACAGVGIFMLVDRWIQRRNRPPTDGSLQSCLQASLVQVNHQIWLLQNILWWYLSPVAVGMSAVIGATAWVASQQPGIGWMLLIGVATYAVVCVAVFWGVYWLNQNAVANQLEPRRRELEKLRDSLQQTIGE